MGNSDTFNNLLIDKTSAANDGFEEAMTKLERPLGLVALVGRPNVGKSALFNSLTGSREAIVGDHEGLTRDRRYGVVACEGAKFTLVDCGGVLGDRTISLVRETEAQTQLAIKEADLLLVVVDARVGCLQEEVELTKLLRRTGKPMILVVNKAEGWKADHCWQFAQLGITDCHFVSALQFQGLNQLRKQIVAQLLERKGLDAAILEQAREWHKQRLTHKQQTATSGAEAASSDDDSGRGHNHEQRDTLRELHDGAIMADDGNSAEDEAQKPPKITFFGCPNAGKSTLINRVVGYERLVAADLPGTTRDSVQVPFVRGGRDYVLIDTAGIRKQSRIREKVESVSVAKSLEALRLSDLAVLLIDAVIGPRDQDLKLIEEVAKAGKGLVIAVNKHDLVDDSRLAQLKDELHRRLAFIQHAPIVNISARLGRGLSGMWRAIESSLQAKRQRFSTGRLNQILQKAVAHHPAALVGGRAVKLRYVHIGSTDPLQLIIHGARATGISDSYQRYLEGFFRRELRLAGFPIKLTLKNTKSHGDE